MFAHGLMFHRFRGDGEPAAWQGALSAAEFEDVLLRAGIGNILSPGEWIERSRRGALQPTDRCVTLDDGLRCQIEVALPVLARLGIRAFWFVYTSVWDGVPVKSEIYSYVAGQTGGMERLIRLFLQGCPPSTLARLESNEFLEYAKAMREVAPFYSAEDLQYRFLRNRPDGRQEFEETMDRVLCALGSSVDEVSSRLWLTREDGKALVEDGHLVGLHSHDHPYDLARLTIEEQERQYRQNFDRIVGATGVEPAAVAHPLNSYRDETLAILERMGISCGFRANMVPPRGKCINPGPLEWARVDSKNLVEASRTARA